MTRHWSLDYWKLAEDLDFVSFDNYPHGVSEPAEVAMNLDLMRSFKQRAFWVMEQQPGPVNWHPYRPPVPPGQVRTWTHQAIAHGAEAIVYFRFRAGRYGQEQYHTGLLKWDASLDQAFYEAQAVARDLAPLPDLTRPQARVGIVFDYHDLWSIELEPANQNFSYCDLVVAIYRAYWNVNIPVDFVPRGVDPAGYDTLIVPAPILIHPGEADTWRTWVENGGRLIVTCRAGVREASNISTDEPLPGGGLADLIGAHVTDYFSVPPGSYQGWPDHRPGSQIGAVSNGRTQTYHTWAETLAPTTADTLFVYNDGLTAGQAAITRHAIGQGEAIYLGCWLEDFAELARQQGWIPGTASRLQHATLTGADGTQWRLTLNHSGQRSEGLDGFAIRYQNVDGDA